MNQHTPGPWHIGMKPGPIVYGERGEQVASLTTDLIYGSLLPQDEAIANARLIAAAPELFAALVGLEAACRDTGTQGMTNLLNRARAAINLAKGE